MDEVEYGSLSETCPMVEVSDCASLPDGELLFESFESMRESLSLAPVQTSSRTLAGAVSPSSVSAQNGSFRVTIIESGVSDNNNWYRPSVLRQAISLFEGAPIRIYNFDGRNNGYNSGGTHHDHMPAWVAQKDAGSVTGNTVGALRNVKFESVQSLRNPGQLVPALTAQMVVVDPTTKSKLIEAWNSGLLDVNKRALFELSIEAEGPHVRVLQEGRDIKRVEAIANVREVTIVSRGAAGGRVLEFNPETTMSESEEIREAVEEVVPSKKLSNPSKNKKDSDQDFNKDSRSSLSKVKPVEDLTDEDVEDGEKAIKMLRSGNIDLGIDILENIFEEDDDEDGDENEDGDADEESLLTGNLLPKPEKKLLKRESLPGVCMVETYKNLVESISKTETELFQMRKNQEQEHDEGSELQESPATMRQMQEELLNFSRFMAERDAEREQRFNEAVAHIQDQGQWREAQEEMGALRECQRYLASTLRHSGLPISTQSLIAEEYDGCIFMESDLEESVERHRRHLVKITEGMSYEEPQGRIMEAAGYSGHGYTPHVSVGRNQFDWVQAEFDRAFGYDPSLDQNLSESQRDTYRQLPAVASIRRPLGVWHDDPEFSCSGNVGPNALLREATSTSTGLSVILQNSMTKALLQQFAIQPALWREIADTEPVANYLEQQRIVLGGLGRLPQVVESDSGSTYLRLGIPSSDQMKFTVGNYGGLICVTRQAIINDNLQVIQAYPQQAAESAIMTLNLLVFGTAIGAYGNGATAGTINTATSYTGNVLFHANHGNVTTSALAYDSLVSALDRLSLQRKFGNVGYLNTNISISDTTFVVTTSEFAEALKAGDSVKIDAEIVKVASKSGTTITIVGAFAAAHTAGGGTLRIEQLSNPIAFKRALLLVPTQLRAAAFTLLASALKPGSTYAGMGDVSFLAPFYANKELLPLAVHPMYLQDDITNWYLMADQPVRVGFLGGREDPQLLLQDNPLVNNVFSGDLISWKCFHEYGATSKGHLQMQGGIVA